MGRIPVAKTGKILERIMCRSVAKTFLGRLSLQGASSSKFNSSFQAINSFDQRKSLMLATSSSSSPVQAYLPCAGLVKQLKDNLFHNWTVQQGKYLDVSCGPSPRVHEQQQQRQICWYCSMKVLDMLLAAIFHCIWQCIYGFRLKPTFLFWK